jgi:hypothetical protein
VVTANTKLPWSHHRPHDISQCFFSLSASTMTQPAHSLSSASHGSNYLRIHWSSQVNYPWLRSVDNITFSDCCCQNRDWCHYQCRFPPRESHHVSFHPDIPSDSAQKIERVCFRTGFTVSDFCDISCLLHWLFLSGSYSLLSTSVDSAEALDVLWAFLLRRSHIQLGCWSGGMNTL